MFPARFHRLSRALDLALEFATLGELRQAEPLDTWEEPGAGRPENAAAAELAPSLPPPFQPATAAALARGAAPPFPPATAAGRRAAEERRALDAQNAAELARAAPACAGARHQRAPSRPASRSGRHREGAAKPPEQPCLWTGH